jgi:hypothetical protein
VTPTEALALVLRVGTVESSDGALKVRMPRGRFARLALALEVLRNAKAEVHSVLARSSAKAHRSQIENPEPSALPNGAGCRLMRLEAGDAIGVWFDLNSLAIRNALHILGIGELPVLYLDAPVVPLRYKLRRVTGEPVPEYVRREMERHSEPWKVGEQMLGRAWRFVPWPLPAAKRSHYIDPRTRIRPIEEWSSSRGRLLGSQDAV